MVLLQICSPALVHFNGPAAVDRVYTDLHKGKGVSRTLHVNLLGLYVNLFGLYKAAVYNRANAASLRQSVC